jgi:hypothetical protein
MDSYKEKLKENPLRRSTEGEERSKIRVFLEKSEFKFH